MAAVTGMQPVVAQGGDDVDAVMAEFTGVLAELRRQAAADWSTTRCE